MSFQNIEPDKLPIFCRSFINIQFFVFVNGYCPPGLIDTTRMHCYLFHSSCEIQRICHTLRSLLFYGFILSLSFPEHLKITNLLGASIISSPVAGFRPLRFRFSLTQNLPNPLIRTSSPDSNSLLIIFRAVSIDP